MHADESISSETPTTEPTASGGRLEPAIDGEWLRVSTKQIGVEISANLLMAVVAAAAGLVLWQWWGAWWPLVAGGALVVVSLVGVVIAPRRVRAIGYRLRDDDLLVRRGILWVKFVAVPYGRMQLIDVTRGPIARAFGLASLQFHTAAAVSSVQLDGLEAAVADDLRDRLVALAESRRAGL